MVTKAVNFIYNNRVINKLPSFFIRHKILNIIKHRKLVKPSI